jgi:hypothetical protein
MPHPDFFFKSSTTPAPTRRRLPPRFDGCRRGCRRDEGARALGGARDRRASCVRAGRVQGSPARAAERGHRLMRDGSLRWPKLRICRVCACAPPAPRSPTTTTCSYWCSSATPAWASRACCSASLTTRGWIHISPQSVGAALACRSARPALPCRPCRCLPYLLCLLCLLCRPCRCLARFLCSASRSAALQRCHLLTTAKVE